VEHHEHTESGKAEFFLHVLSGFILPIFILILIDLRVDLGLLIS
jgi:hypothetical protein